MNPVYLFRLVSSPFLDLAPHTVHSEANQTRLKTVLYFCTSRHLLLTFWFKMRFSLPLSLPDMNSYSYSSRPRSNITSSVKFLLTPSCKTFHLSSKSTCIFFRICCSAFIMIYLPPTYFLYQVKLPVKRTMFKSFL